VKKFVIIPDSFKGTMSSSEICTIMEAQIKTYYPDAKIVSLPVADGGEGSVDALLAAMSGKKVFIRAKNPYMEDIDGFYGVTENGTAIIEMAACAGLPLVEDNQHPDKATTYGVGQLMVHAATHGCKKIIVGLGGSCTNDAGAGAAVATGIKFKDKNGLEFLPTGDTLGNIAKIDLSGQCPQLKAAEIIAMCDIDNPFYGITGAAHVFGPQKGATPVMVELLDDGLKKLSETIKAELCIDISKVPGSGAAGGMGGGMLAFFNAKLQRGIETNLDAVDFDALAKDADLVFSGEGKIDPQSLRGKVVIGVACRTKKLGVPLIAIVGDIGDDIQSAYDMGVSAIFSINRVAVDFNQAKQRCKSDLALTMDNLMRLMVKMNF
jgi:glycerate 2-kinase